jgi:hypothetical protein
MKPSNGFAISRTRLIIFAKRIFKRANMVVVNLKPFILLKVLIVVSFLAVTSCKEHFNQSIVPPQVIDTVSKIQKKNAPAVCNSNFDTTLVRLAKSFHATNSDVTHSMSRELNQFMLQVDTNCLRKQKMYRFFINAILAKVVLHQLRCCNQHYEMRHEKDGAEVILNEFEMMAGFRNKQIEFLSSYEVEAYIQKTPDLHTNAYLKSIMKKINTQGTRISSGHI